VEIHEILQSEERITLLRQIQRVTATGSGGGLFEGEGGCLCVCVLQPPTMGEKSLKEISWNLV
jgi:hypothetical protein